MRPRRAGVSGTLAELFKYKKSIKKTPIRSGGFKPGNGPVMTRRGAASPEGVLVLVRPACGHQRSSDSTVCGTWFACARTAVPACCRIWARVMAETSVE